MSPRLARTLCAPLVLLAALAALALTAGNSLADTAVDQAVAALNSGASVYNDPAAERVLTTTQASTLTIQARKAGTRCTQ
jgi:hypothetical protein